MRRKVIFVLFLVLTFSVSAAPKERPAKPKADLVLRHGRVYTMDAARSWAESVALQNGKIVFVGEDAGLSEWIGPETKTIELGDRFVLPGFIDAHVHPVEAGIGLTQCDLSSYEKKEDILKAIAEYAKNHPFNEWILGSGWPLPSFPEANPKKEWLDEIIPDRPAFFSAADGHSAWVNSKALEAAGITRETADPPDGRFERDGSGMPSGTLREGAATMVYQHAPHPKMEESIAGLQEAIRIMNSFGITGFLDASVSTQGDTPEARGSAEVYREADKRNILNADVTAALYANPDGTVEDVLKQIHHLKEIREQFKGVHFHPTTVKLFADGVIESNTAALLHPYLDKGDQAGELNWGPEKLNPFVELLDQEGFQIHVHAIGDRAIRITLTALESLIEKRGFRDRRPVLAHIELIDPLDVPRFAKLSVIPCFQPLWAYADLYIKDLTLPKLGKERSRWIYPIQSVAATGATMAFGSDWNVSSVNPLDGIEVAVTRQPPSSEANSEEPFIPEERIDIKTALEAYTIGSAYATFREKQSGSIEPGKLGNLIVLSENLFTIPASKINETKVLLTLFEGKEVFRSPDWIQ